MAASMIIEPVTLKKRMKLTIIYDKATKHTPANQESFEVDIISTTVHDDITRVNARTAEGKGVLLLTSAKGWILFGHKFYRSVTIDPMVEHADDYYPDVPVASRLRRQRIALAD